VLRSGLLLESGVDQHNQDLLDCTAERAGYVSLSKPRHEGMGDPVLGVSENDGSNLVEIEQIIHATLPHTTSLPG
jgi:hypothetical protein